jgi:maleylpyruvate isomerase
MKLTLYSYFRSSAAYRVRIGLNLKGLEYHTIGVNLLQSEQRAADYLALNPHGLVPALQLPDGRLLAQSVAILEWLEDSFPEPALLPPDACERARVRAMCQSIACDIHPLNNLRVLNYLSAELGVADERKTAWYHHWLELGFSGLEQQIGNSAFCAGDAPGMADAFLVPQIANALRFRFDMGPFPGLMRINERCCSLDAFARAHPDAQPDNPSRPL